MKPIFLVGLGGCLGAMARFKIGGWIFHATAGWEFPVSTFFINVFGCFIAGILTGVLENQNVSTADLRLFIFTGILGGFTTFSAFGLETVTLLRRGESLIAFANALLSVIVAVTALWVGLRLASLR